MDEWSGVALARFDWSTEVVEIDATPDSQRARGAVRARTRLLPALLIAMLLGGCGDGGDGGAAQPAPDSTTFVQGRFDDLPQFPRSEPVSPTNEKNGVVVRSFLARGATPEAVLNHYRDVLISRGWRMVGNIEEIGMTTYRADWVNEEHRLRVSATSEPQLAEDAPSDQVTTQYSLTLRPT